MCNDNDSLCGKKLRATAGVQLRAATESGAGSVAGPGEVPVHQIQLSQTLYLDYFMSPQTWMIAKGIDTGAGCHASYSSVKFLNPWGVMQNGY